MRDYIHVTDLGRAHCLGLEWLVEEGVGSPALDGASGETPAAAPVFNLGNGRGFSNLAVVRTCAEVTGVDLAVTLGPRRPGDPAALVASSDRARDVLGWRPERGALSDIVGDAWAWHRSHPHGYAEGPADASPR